MSVRHLESYLAPRSVAVVGASDRPGSVGATVWRNLRAGGFTGAIHAVNPSHATLDGATVLAEVADLPEGVDLALVCTPPATVPAVVAGLAARQARAAVVMTAGLDSAQRQAMLDAARPATLRILGPNCLGLLAPHAGLNASFAHTEALPGGLAFVTQSGAIGTAVLDWARSRGLGLSCMVSLGEHADVDFGDMLDFLASDANTHAILLYIESVESPRKFMSAARAAARNKPVIVVKAGRAGRGIAAASSHTGAMAGSDAVYEAAIRRAGMLRVDTLAELFIAAETLARFGSNRDTRLTVMTNGGGAGVMAADAAARAGVELAELEPALRAHLDVLLPPTWSHGNPIDMIGDAPIERYTGTLRALLETRSAGAVLFMHAPTAIVRSADIARACAPIASGAASRLMACWLGDEGVAEARQIFESAGIADYATPEDAIHAFALLQSYHRNQAQLMQAPAALVLPPADIAAARGIVQAALAQGRRMLAEDEAKAVLSAYRIPTVATQRCAPDPDAAAQAAESCGFPAVLKILSRDITHKSDVGGVALGLVDAEAVRAAAARMLEQVAQGCPGAHIDGFTLQAMVKRPEAQELIVGASVDAVFGPVILFGQGGTAVEVVADRALALPPLNRVLAKELVSRTRVAALLGGYRDRAPADLDAIAGTLIRISQLMADLPELAELDINPLWADSSGVLALDARMRIDPACPGGSERFAIQPYPDILAETADWHGGHIELRPIRPEDQGLHLDFVASLAPEDLRLRFFTSTRELPLSQTARLVQIDYSREMAFVAIDRAADGSARMLGVARSVADPDNVEAEFAVIVRSDMHQAGLGTLLMNKLLRYLRGRGIQRVVGDVLRENSTMRALAADLGFRIESSAAGALHYVLKLDQGR